MIFRNYRGVGLTPIWVIMGLCLMVLVATTFREDIVIRQLALIPATVRTEPWTMVTNLFVHSGIWHFLVNMFTLYFFGSYLIQLIGEAKFLIIYFAGGLLGNIFYLLLPSSLFAPVIGASGAIFALGGTLTVLEPNSKVLIFPIPIPMPLWVAVIGGFFLASIAPGVAWQGHLGGLVFGLVAGYFFRRRQRRSYW